jgi:LPS export ABC transporter permease LptG
MDVNRSAKTIQMVLEDGTRHKTQVDDPTAYEVLRFERTVVTLDPERVFPKEGPARGDRELTIAELEARAAELSAQGLSPHNQIIEIHTKFSIPVACFVFAILGLALGASHRRDGRLASFVVGIAVIFIYYVIMFTARSMTKGHLIPAWSAMWWPNLILGAAGVWLLLSRARSADQPLRFPLLGWLSARTTQSSADNSSTGSASQQSAQIHKHSATLKLPSVTALRPNILDVYLAKHYLQVLGMTVVGMLGLFYISTFIDLSDKWFKGQATLAMLLEFLWWSTPQFLSYVIALAVLLSALVTIGLLTKNSELIVMRACGISLYRTAVPLVVFGILGSALLFGLEESFLATANQRAGRLNHIIRGGSPQTFDVLNRKWVVGHDGEVYHYQFYDPRRHELNGISVFEFDPAAHAIANRIYAAKAIWQATPGGPGEWRLENGWSRKFGSAAEITAFDRFETRNVALEPPEYFVTEAPEPDRMTFNQLRAYINELRASGYNVLDHEVGLYRKIAFPFVTLVMTLIAVPFAVSTGRRGAMYGVGVGIVLALVYWTMISVFAAFGAGGLMSPMLAAWAPNLLFGATAAVLVLTVRT